MRVVISMCCAWDVLVCVDCDCSFVFFFFQAEDGIRDDLVTGVQTCALPISVGPLAPDLNWPSSDPLCRHKEKKMYTEWQYQFENRKIRTTTSKLVNVPIFAALLRLLAEKRPNTVPNESYLNIIKVKPLFQFCCCLLHQFWMGDAGFFWNVSANLMIFCRGFLSFKFSFSLYAIY